MAVSKKQLRVLSLLDCILSLSAAAVISPFHCSQSDLCLPPSVAVQSETAVKFSTSVAHSFALISFPMIAWEETAVSAL